MRTIYGALVLGILAAACGGEEAGPPKAPTTTVATTPPPPPPTATETVAPTPPPKPTLAELEMQAGKAFAESMNAHDAKKASAVYAENAIFRMPGAPADITGRDAIAGVLQKNFDAFSNSKIGVSRIWSKDDVVIAEWVMNGTHSGEFMGVKATEKPVGWTGLSVLWFNQDGQIKEEHAYWDMGTVMSQIGASKQKARAVPALPAQPATFAAAGSDTETKNVAASKTYYGAFEKKSEADFLSLAADGIEWDDMLAPTTSKGKDDAKKFYGMMSKAFPDGKVTVANSWGVGDFVITESAFSGTHKAAFMGIAPTKKSVNMHGIDVVQMKDGKAVHGWSFANSSEMMGQLGLLPQPGAKTTAAAPKATPKSGGTAAPKSGGTPAPKSAGTSAPKAPPAPKK